MGLSHDDYEVLFLGGGASSQFAMVPMNFLSADGKAAYIHTGEWSRRAIGEARCFGRVEVIAGSEDRHFSALPADIPTPVDACYLHYTSNNTIFGTAFDTIPDPGDSPLICDMSSDFLSRPLDFSAFSLIYAGAQKNIGPAGATVVVIERGFAEKGKKEIPNIYSYAYHVKAKGVANTPPVYAIYMIGLVAQWLKAGGGLEAMGIRNEKKAAILYATLDALDGFYRPTVKEPAHRSRMNVTFRLRDPSLDSTFLKEAEEAGFRGLKGHRSVGGFRASIYNAFPIEGVEALAHFLKAFASRYG